MTSSRRASLLVVLAHPDDEVFHGGMLMHLSQQGVRVTLVCATNGEAGTPHSSIGAAVLAKYPAATDAQVSVAAPLLDGESRLVAPTVLTARAVSRVSDVYIYRFSRVPPSSRSAWGGAAHTSEVSYVFDNTGGDSSQFDEIDRTVSGVMSDAWVRFARRGNPNGGGLPQWPAYRSPDYRLLDFGDTVTVRSNARNPEIEFFQRTFETMHRKPSILKAPTK